MRLTEAELALVDRWQRDFPLVPRPFAVVGEAAGIGERQAIAAFERLRRRDVITRIGAVVRPHTVGASTLAAMRVPAARLQEVADIVSAEPLVSHNYERSHAQNLWFVVAGPDPSAVAATLRSVESRSDLPVLDLPLLQAYHLDLGFALGDAASRRRRRRARGGAYRPQPADRGLFAALEDGLPFEERPYRTVGIACGLDEQAVTGRLRQLEACGVVSRFGCIVRHRTLGYTANAMAVWDVADDDVDAAAAACMRERRVTLCYRRARRAPAWPYNLYCMIHARARAEALSVVDELNARAGLGGRPQAVLFSERCFKQRGAVFSGRAGKVS